MKSFDYSKDNYIFGASNGGKRLAKILSDLKITYVGFMDNDIEKIGHFFRGKKIVNLEMVLPDKNNINIFLGSVFVKEIKEQLFCMGIKEEDIWTREEIIIDYIFSKNIINIDDKYIMNMEKTILFDLPMGVILGGVETWTLALAQNLKQFYRVKILGKNDGEYRGIENYLAVESDNDDYWKGIKNLVEIIKENLPAVIIISTIGQLFIAASIIKHILPRAVKIIAVIHTDLDNEYKKHIYYDGIIDSYMCVSVEIKNKFIEKYKCKEEKIYYKESPVEFEPKWKKQYSEVDKPIVLSYAGRLESYIKNANLLIPFIDQLEKENINYILYIAGTGEMFEKIVRKIEKEKLREKVILFGLIEHSEMPVFWKKCDVFVNFSEAEGSSLAMLEAMSYGVVPVVSKTSGTADFIENGVNGYLCDNNMLYIIKKIKNFCENRKTLEVFSEICREKIRLKCDKNKYNDYFVDLIERTSSRKDDKI